MKEEEPQDTRKPSAPPRGDELQPRKDVTVKPPTAPARAEALPPNVISERLVGTIRMATLVGLLGLVPAAFSTIWFTPQCSFDAWYTRLSEGFVLGGALGGFIRWRFGWPKDLKVLAKRRNPLTWRPRR